MIKKAEYDNLDGTKRVVEYDSEAACLICGKPVEAASMGGTRICPWCDCGQDRDGRNWTLEEAHKLLMNKNTA